MGDTERLYASRGGSEEEEEEDRERETLEEKSTKDSETTI